MPDQNTPLTPDESSDARIDAFAAVAMILCIAGMFVLWVASQ